MRSLVAKSILSDCIHYAAPLYAYVVMPHHVHFVVQAPVGRTVSWLVQRIKTNSSKIIAPQLTPSELAELSDQTQLNNRQVWMRSFRGLAIPDKSMLDQKTDYVRDNPVKLELCESAVEYLWSSVRASIDGAWDESSGLALACVRELERTLHTMSVEG